ncbi:MAG: acyltransferase domain-containing protein, partial [Myxococcales bacterium]|nr:acyltransferase domain-containing protein [Myxococcales bacterium]
MAFVFPGGGTQYANMGRALYATEPVFREHIDRCAEISRAQLGVDLRAWMYPAPADAEVADRQLREPRHSVPAVWMTSYALAQQLLSWGITPQHMLGHSVGEYVAACVAGVLSVEDALTLATFRALVFERATAADRGASLSVNLGEAALRPLLPPTVDIAVVSTPSSCVASGPSPGIAKLEQLLTEREVVFKRLHIGAAVHSSLMDPVMAEVTERARGITVHPPRIPYGSNLHGRRIEPGDLTPDYWARHLRHTVRFADNVRDMLAHRGLVVIEVGAGTSLASAVSEQIDLSGTSDAVMISAMRQARDPRGDREVLVQCMAAAWSHGVDVDWQAFEGEDVGERVAFPVYSFERTRHWIEAGRELGQASAPSLSPSSSAASRPDVILSPGQADDALARQVAEAWGEQLGVSVLAPESNFFALGGTSLAAVRLIAKLQRRLQPTRRLLPEELLRTPSFGAFVEHVRPSCGVAPLPSDPPPPSSSALVLLRPGRAEDRAPLFIVHPAGGHVFHYRLLAEALDPDVTVYGLKAPGLEDGQSALRTIEALAEYHLRAIRSAGHTGPYQLAGSSLGGCVAYEMAQQLRAAGERPALLALLDTPSPDNLPRFDDHVEYVEYLFGDMWGVALSRAELAALPEAARIPHALA